MLHSSVWRSGAAPIWLSLWFRVASTITDFDVGYVFDSVTIKIEAERVETYIEAVGDNQFLSQNSGLVPPLAVVAFALGSLLKSVGLPQGSLHVNESVEFLGAVNVGDSVECHARLAQRSQRSGWFVSVLETEISMEGRTVSTAKATVMSPVDGS